MNKCDIHFELIDGTPVLVELKVSYCQDIVNITLGANKQVHDRACPRGAQHVVESKLVPQTFKNDGSVIKNNIDKDLIIDLSEDSNSDYSEWSNFEDEIDLTQNNEPTQTGDVNEEIEGLEANDEMLKDEIDLTQDNEPTQTGDVNEEIEGLEANNEMLKDEIDLTQESTISNIIQFDNSDLNIIEQVGALMKMENKYVKNELDSL
ncbi:MAG: hypothetical protein EZS28_001063 [Streblomastix strix]|uniref:Uncharacterized protein n=1 Tax=Streblomastix strix TaxID=222440 RepID=A0A5J4X9C6_9EUKA|nr:MAG: hypothetical protein EZS28_001063 [Streblomastix strix]